MFVFCVRYFKASKVTGIEGTLSLIAYIHKVSLVCEFFYVLEAECVE
jgi:hypothetical protein